MAGRCCQCHFRFWLCTLHYRAQSWLALCAQRSVCDACPIAKSILCRSLFMCEVDNVCFELALDERTRSRVEEAGHVRLTDTEATALGRMKFTHVALIVASVLLVVRLSGSSLAMKESFDGNPVALFSRALVVVPIAYWLGGVLETFCLRPLTRGYHQYNYL